MQLAVNVTTDEEKRMAIDEQKNDGPVGLYLDLLKKTLTNTIYNPEPGEESEAIFVRGFIDHYIQGTAISMLPMARLDNLPDRAETPRLGH
jgi:hypothetical protein